MPSDVAHVEQGTFSFVFVVFLLVVSFTFMKL
jgi:hypothetical protein